MVPEVSSDTSTGDPEDSPIYGLYMRAPYTLQSPNSTYVLYAISDQQRGRSLPFENHWHARVLLNRHSLDSVVYYIVYARYTTT